MDIINDHKFLIAALLSGVVFIAFLLLIAIVNISNPDNVSVIAIMSSSLFSFTYALLVREAAWYLGIFTSFIYWLYLSLVSISLYTNQQADWWPLGEALIIVVMACIAVQCARLVKRRFTPPASTAR